eukprot:3900864-Amphidinium_carterae.1
MRLAHILSHGVTSSLGVLYSCIDNAVADVKNIFAQFGDDPFVQQGAIVATLYATMIGDRGRLQSLIARWLRALLGPNLRVWVGHGLYLMARQFMPTLANANKRVRQVLDGAKLPSDFDAAF